jgi:hypothetical protein
VKIGNWNEDIARTEVAAQDYESRRAKGDLVHITKAREKTFLSQPVPHSYSADGTVRYGMTVMLATGFSEGAGGSGGGSGAAFAPSPSTRYLANLMFNLLSPGRARVTAGAEARPQARNTFVLGRSGDPRAPGLPEDDILRYGDRVTLAANPSLTADPATRVEGLPFYLHSTRGNNVLGTTRKGRQDVCLCKARDADAVWVVQAASGDRLATEGLPVPPGAPCTLTHAMSNVMLAGAGDDTYLSDFGVELSIHCATHKGTGQLAVTPAGGLPVLPAQGANVWAFALAAHPGAAVDGRGLVPLTPAALLQRVRGDIARASGTHGLRSVRLAFEALDPRGLGRLPLEACKWALYEHGMRVEEAEWGLLTGAFATGKPPSVALDRGAFWGALRGEGLSEGAQGGVRAAFAHVSGGGGEVPLGVLCRAFDAKLEPRVVAGRVLRAEAKAEFGRQWPTLAKRGGAGAVGEADFLEYYGDVVGMLEGGEGALGALLANTWHLPGQGSWKVKRSLRVLATFHKGSSTEAVIPEGEDIHPEDQEALMERLKKMGFGGIARVKVLALEDPKDEE